MTQLPIRYYSRICIPGLLVSRAIEALQRPMLLAGPELAKFLEPHVERLSGISAPSRWQRWLRDAGRWLLEAPDIEPETTEGSMPSDQAARATGLSDDELHPEIQVSPSVDGAEPVRVSINNPDGRYIDTEVLALFLKQRRQLRVERAKDALHLIERLVLARLAQDENTSIDDLAEDFAVLLFGKN